MRIEIVGTGCAKCKRQTKNVERAVKEMGVDVEVVKVEDISAIMNSGVMMTPAIAIDGEIKASGRIVDVEELKRLLA